MCNFCPYVIEGDSLRLPTGGVSCADRGPTVTPYHLKAPVARHVCPKHDRDPRCLKCWVLDVVPQDRRRGKFDQIVFQRESHCIWELEATKSPGLND